MRDSVANLYTPWKLRKNKPRKRRNKNFQECIGPDAERVTEFQIRDDDVIFGKGRSFMNNPGNLRMKEIVRKNKQHYDKVHRSRKKDVLEAMYDEITKNGGRFLHKTIDDDDSYRIVNIQVALKKVRNTIFCLEEQQETKKEEQQETKKAEENRTNRSTVTGATGAATIGGESRPSLSSMAPSMAMSKFLGATFLQPPSTISKLSYLNPPFSLLDAKRFAADDLLSQRHYASLRTANNVAAGLASTRPVPPPLGPAVSTLPLHTVVLGSSPVPLLALPHERSYSEATMLMLREQQCHLARWQLWH